MLKTIQLNDPNSDFQVVSPIHGDRLKPNGTYTIRWTTKPRLRIQTVSIRIADTSKDWNEGTVLSVDAPNTGSYRWTVPVKDPSIGPYLLTISPLRSAGRQNARIYQGTSNPFYIVGE